jgi:hypothetical protein
MLRIDVHHGAHITALETLRRQILRGGVCVLPGYKRERFGITNRLNRKVNIQVWPIEVQSGRMFNMRELTDCGGSKPRKGHKRDKQLLVAQQEPKTMR